MFRSRLKKIEACVIISVGLPVGVRLVVKFPFAVQIQIQTQKFYCL